MRHDAPRHARTDGHEHTGEHDMSRRPTRSRITIATAAAVAAALLVPTAGGASASPGAPASASPDTIGVSGTVVVLAGEDGNPDRYSLLLPSGRTVPLAKGFTAEPLSS